MEKHWEISDMQTLPALATAVLAELRQRQNASGKAAVLALHGDLGAGKTTFMQILARELKVSEAVTSPTFVVMKQYELVDQAWTELIHMDAYRLESTDELGPLHFLTLLDQPQTILAIEWAEKIAVALPEHTLHLTFTLAGETRTVSIDG